MPLRRQGKCRRVWRNLIIVADEAAVDSNRIHDWIPSLPLTLESVDERHPRH